jgi:hypothetical protein
VSIRWGNKPTDAPRHRLGFLNAKLGHSVFFEEVVQGLHNKKVFSLRVTPAVAKRFASGQLALAGGARDGQQSQSFQADPGQKEIAISPSWFATIFISRGERRRTTGAR